MIEVLSTGLVYRNPKPFLRSVHAWHPSLVLLEGGEVLASFDLGQAVESLDYRTYLSRSRDEGRTWEPPVPLFDDPVKRPSTHTVRLSRLRDGTVMGFGARFFRDDPEEGLTNRQNLGFVPVELILLVSQDGGRTWTGPRTIAPPVAGPAFEICHPVAHLRDGRLLAPTSTWRGWLGDAPGGMRAVALVSRDRGVTWSEHLEVMDGHAQGVCYWEISLVELPDRRLLALTWAFDEKQGRTLPSPYAIAADGRSFSPPRPTGFHAQTAKMLVLRDGRILCVYRRDDRPGLWANLVRIEGSSWVNIEEAALWQGAPSGMTGERTASEELAGLKFGYPSLVELPGGDVLSAFWCLEDCIHDIRWLRLRVG